MTTAALSGDGSTLATVSEDGRVRLWDVATMELRETLTGHHSAVTSVAFGPDGTMLAAAAEDGTVRLWHVAVPTLAEAVDQLCGAIDRDLTEEERRRYLPDHATRPVCP